MQWRKEKHKRSWDKEVHFVCWRCRVPPLLVSVFVSHSPPGFLRWLHKRPMKTKKHGHPIGSRKKGVLFAYENTRPWRGALEWIGDVMWVSVTMEPYRTMTPQVDRGGMPGITLAINITRHQLALEVDVSTTWKLLHLSGEILPLGYNWSV